MSRLAVSADFHNADTEGRLRLNAIGTIRDLSRQAIALREGRALTLHDEELECRRRGPILARRASLGGRHRLGGHPSEAGGRASG